MTYRNIINFNSDKAVIVYALQGDGGKFLSSLLGLSPSAILMSNVNPGKTDYCLDFSKDTLHKESVIKQHLVESQTTGRWNDFRISTSGCFGDHNEIYHSGFIDSPELLPFNRIVSNIIDSDSYFFMCIHSPDILKLMIKVWPNAKIVAVTRSAEFIDRYRKNAIIYNDSYGKLLNSLRDLNWYNIRGEHYQSIPPKNKSELDKHKKLLIDDFGLEFYQRAADRFDYADQLERSLHRYFSKLKQENKLIFFDSSAFLNSKELISSLDLLYNFLNLEKIDFSRVQEIHCQWLDVIGGVKY